MRQIGLKAYAKLNLSLEIVGRRDDGYHNIVSLMQGISLCDKITLKKCAENGTKYNLPHCTIGGHVVYLCTSEKTIPTDMKNLAFKGIEAMLEGADGVKVSACRDYDEPWSLMVEIEKNLPVAAGIAGGSGNGAAAMLGLNALMGYPFSLRELMQIGGRVGADVPFSLFMNAYRNKEAISMTEGIEEAADAAWICGIGDIVERAEPVKRYVIMANPGIAVSTEAAYRAIDEIGYDGLAADGQKRLFINDLEKYTLENYPEAAALKQMMTEKLGADEVLMSGSGPTIAAYYKCETKAISDIKLMEQISADEDIRYWLTSTGISQEETFAI